MQKRLVVTYAPILTSCLGIIYQQSTIFEPLIIGYDEVIDFLIKCFIFKLDVYTQKGDAILDLCLQFNDILNLLI